MAPHEELSGDILRYLDDALSPVQAEAFANISTSASFAEDVWSRNDCFPVHCANPAPSIARPKSFVHALPRG
jgi:hypothetical protein